MEYMVWPIIVFGLIVWMECKRGRLRKKWQQWVALVAYVVGPWLVFVALERFSNLRLQLAANLILPAFYLLGVFLFAPGTSGRCLFGRGDLEQPTGSGTQIRGRLQRSIEIVGSGILTASFSVAIGFLITSQMDAKSIGGIFAGEFGNYLAILGYSAIWVGTTFFGAFVAVFISPKKGVLGLVVGACTSICLAYVHMRAPSITRILMIVGPLVGGYAGARSGEVLSSYVRRKHESQSICG